MRRAALALALTALAGCLEARGGDPEDKVDAATSADAATADASGLDAPPPPPCSERLPGVEGVVEDPDTHHCYFVGIAVATYEKATQDCAAVDAHMVQIAGDAELAILVDELLVVEASWWIGLAQTGDDEWTWATGDLLGVWDAWGEGQPSGDGACVELFLDAEGECVDGCWNDVPCDYEKAAICELGLTG